MKGCYFIGLLMLIYLLLAIFLLLSENKIILKSINTNLISIEVSFDKMQSQILANHQATAGINRNLANLGIFEDCECTEKKDSTTK